MSNQIVPLGYANTFGDWIVTTNKVLAETNDIGANNYIKDSGTFTINSSGTGLLVKNDAIVQGVLTVAGSGSSATVQNDLTVQRQLYLSNTQTSLLANGTANILGNLLVGGMIMPTYGSGSNGISFLGGTTGDFANVKYYATAGDSRRLHLQVTNDTNDDIYLDASGTVVIPNGRDSTSISSGALVVTGGMGIGGDIYIGGTMKVQSTAEIQLGGKVNISNSMLVSANVDIGQRLTVSGNTTLGANLAVTGAAYFGNTTQSTTYDTGAVVVAGGVGIAKNLTVKENVQISTLTASKPVFTDVSKNLTSTGVVPVDQGGTGLTSSGSTGNVLTSNGSFWITSSRGFVTPEDYGAVGDGSTDDTTSIQNAINSGKNVFLTQGKTYKHTTALTISTNNQCFGGPGVIKTVGNINGVVVNGGCTGVELTLTFNSATLQTGGWAIYIDNGNRVKIHKANILDAYGALYIQNANVVNLDWMWAVVRGPGIKWYGTDALRSDLLTINFAIIDVKAGSGAYGMEWNGNCHSFNAKYLGIVCGTSGSRTGNGFIIKNTDGVSTYPAIGRISQVEVDYPLSHGVEITAGLDFDFNIPYILGSSTGSGIKIASGINSYQVRVGGGKSIGNARYGIENASTGVVLFDGSTDLSTNTLGRSLGSVWTQVERLVIDDTFYLTKISNNPSIVFDSNDLITYDRTNNQLICTINSAGVFKIDPSYLQSYVDIYVETLTANKPVFTDANKKLTSAGVVGTGQGGTGLQSFTNGGVVYASSTSALTTGGGLTYNGTDLTCGGNVTAYSDARLKKNIKVIENALEKVNKISGYTFERTDIDVGSQTGVIAQELINVLPEAVSTTHSGMYTVAYGNMVGLLIESIKELNSQVTSLKEEIEKLKNPS